MKKIIAFLVGVMLSAIITLPILVACNAEPKEEVDRIKLIQVELNYIFETGSTMDIVFYFDIENNICYSYMRGARQMQVVDFTTCGNVFVRHVLPTLGATEEE